MSIINPQKLDDLIITYLINGEQKTTSLLELVRKIRKNTTKQGFYAAIRKLKKEEAVLLYKGYISLNTVWINKMQDVFERISQTYTINQKSFDVLNLEDKESISYTFSNIKNLDIFWGHAQNILIHNTSPQQPIYGYDPHYWFYLARRDTEKELLKEIEQNKRQFLITVGGMTKFDKMIKPDFNNNYLQYNYGKLFAKNNYYITVIGDYITEVFLNEDISNKIDLIYMNSNNNLDAINLLKTLLMAKAKNKIKISRNKLRAEKLKKRMGKDFYIIKNKP